MPKSLDNGNPGWLAGMNFATDKSIQGLVQGGGGGGAVDGVASHPTFRNGLCRKWMAGHPPWTFSYTYVL